MKTETINLNKGDYPMKSDRFHVWMYVKNEYKFSSEEDLLDNLSKKYHGLPTGSGTDLSTGKRDVSFAFPTKRDVSNFLRNKLVKDVTYRPSVKEVES